MNIHQRINVKGNLKTWGYGQKMFLRLVGEFLRSGYAGEIHSGKRLFYAQDGKTNVREPREPYYEGNGEFAENH